MKYLRIFLPRDRSKPGFFHLFDIDGHAVLTNIRCLGKADAERAIGEGNPDRHPDLPYGDTPAGTFEPTALQMFPTPHPRMGTGCIPLVGASGQALDAKLRGRTGLAIHAGRGDDRLVPTYGCIRLLQRDFDEVAKLLADAEPLNVTVETWNFGSYFANSAWRGGKSTDDRHNNDGFRVARTL